MDRRQFLIGTTGLVLASGVSRFAFAQEPAIPDYYPEDYNAIIEGSKAENSLLVYGNMDQPSWAAVVERFNQQYPWIAVETLDINSSELIERYLAENGTGSRTADFLVSNALEGWLNLLERGEVMDYRSPESDHLPAVAMPAPGLYAIAVDPMLFAWNKLLLPPERVPTNMTELAEMVKADPDFFRGRITTYAPDVSATGFQSHFAQTVKHGDKAWEWYDVIAPMIRGENSNGPMLEKLISGEYLLAYDILPGNVWLAVADPAVADIIGWSFIEGGTYVNLRGAGIPNGSTNVNSAKLWLDTILSREGQIAMAMGGRTPVRTDVTPEDVEGRYTYASVLETIPEDEILTVGYDQKVIDGRQPFLDRWAQALAR